MNAPKKRRIANHAKPPTPRAVSAAHLLLQLDALQAPIAVAVVELRSLGLGVLADSLSAEALHLKQIHTTASTQLLEQQEAGRL